MRIALWHGHDILSKMISAVSRGQYTHAAVQIQEGSPLIIEAYTPRVRVRIFTPEEAKNMDFFEVKGLTQAQQEKALAWFHDHIGDDYAETSLFRFIPGFRALFGDEKEKDFNNRFFCSAFVFRGLQEAGVDLLSRIRPWEVSPTILSYSPLLEKIQ